MPRSFASIALPVRRERPYGALECGGEEHRRGLGVVVDQLQRDPAEGAPEDLAQSDPRGEAGSVEPVLERESLLTESLGDVRELRMQQSLSGTGRLGGERGVHEPSRPFGLCVCEHERGIAEHERRGVLRRGSPR